jgi:hypothetical protein
VRAEDRERVRGGRAESRLRAESIAWLSDAGRLDVPDLARVLAIVRSDENTPMPATFAIGAAAHGGRSRYRRVDARLARDVASVVGQQQVSGHPPHSSESTRPR